MARDTPKRSSVRTDPVTPAIIARRDQQNPCRKTGKVSLNGARKPTKGMVKGYAPLKRAANGIVSTVIRLPPVKFEVLSDQVC